MRIRGKCKPPTSSYGSASATALAPGVLVIKIHPSAAARRALKTGRRLSTTVVVRFQPARGGTATTRTTALSGKLTKKHRRH